jgi:hypothetical protein
MLSEGTYIWLRRGADSAPSVAKEVAWLQERTGERFLDRWRSHQLVQRKA